MANLCQKAPHSRISDSEMKTIMKSAGTRMYPLLLRKTTSLSEFEARMGYGSLFTQQRDYPEKLSFLEL